MGWNNLQEAIVRTTVLKITVLSIKIQCGENCVGEIVRHLNSQSEDHTSQGKICYNLMSSLKL